MTHIKKKATPLSSNWHARVRSSKSVKRPSREKKKKSIHPPQPISLPPFFPQQMRSGEKKTLVRSFFQLPWKKKRGAAERRKHFRCRGSNPGLAGESRLFYPLYHIGIQKKSAKDKEDKNTEEGKSGRVGVWTLGLLYAKQALYHWATRPRNGEGNNNKAIIQLLTGAWAKKKCTNVVAPVA